MKTFTPFKLANQPDTSDMLIGVEFTCAACHKLKRAILLTMVVESIIEDGAEDDVDCVDCQPINWQMSMLHLVAEHAKKSIVTVSLDESKLS